MCDSPTFTWRCILSPLVLLFFVSFINLLIFLKGLYCYCILAAGLSQDFDAVAFAILVVIIVVRVVVEKTPKLKASTIANSKMNV